MGGQSESADAWCFTRGGLYFFWLRPVIAAGTGVVVGLLAVVGWGAMIGMVWKTWLLV